MNDDLKQLRQRLDGDEGFMSGHQIKKIRTRTKKIPTWATNNRETKQLLLRAFPGLRARRSAARWGAVIHYFYRMNMTYSQIAEELDTTSKAIERILWRIRRHATGKVSNPKGRPKKEGASTRPL